MTFVDLMWSMVVFFFWFMLIWMFISIFADILRRNDLSGWAKAFWLIAIFWIPFFGILIYMIVRPKMTEQDKQILADMEAQQRRAAGITPADEIAKAKQLKDSGAITDAEFEEIKKRALA